MRSGSPPDPSAILSARPVSMAGRRMTMTETMRAMRLHGPGQPLVLEEVPRPEPGPGELQLRVLACGVCRTDLHVVDGELPEPRLPLVPGHEVIGEVTALGEGVTGVATGQRLGVPWLGWTCGECAPCRRGEENLCERAEFTGYTRDGGYAEYCVADARYAFPVQGDDAQASAPLLCAGLIGYRTWRLAGGEAPRRLGIYGFGAAAHILIQLALARGQRVFAFTRPGDEAAQAFARRLGAEWAGGSVVSGGIHMSDIPSFPYRLLWEERSVKSVANLTRRDGEEFLALAPTVPIRTETRAYPLDQANRALDDLREGRLSGAAVLIP